jgi:hypothetical protein
MFQIFSVTCFESIYSALQVQKCVRSHVVRFYRMLKIPTKYDRDTY